MILGSPARGMRVGFDGSKLFDDTEQS